MTRKTFQKRCQQDISSKVIFQIGTRQYNTKGKGNVWTKVITYNGITNNNFVHHTETNGCNKGYERWLGKYI